MYSCFICYKKYNSIKLYLTHLKLYHKLSINSKYFQCTNCPQSFQNLNAFRLHLVRQHPTLETFDSTPIDIASPTTNIQRIDSVFSVSDGESYVVDTDQQIDYSNEFLSFA